MMICVVVCFKCRPERGLAFLLECSENPGFCGEAKVWAVKGRRALQGLRESEEECFKVEVCWMTLLRGLK